MVSFGLYGTDRKYVEGAVRNAELAETYFPGWVCRFYVSPSGGVPLEDLDRLRELGAEVVEPPGDLLEGEAAGMFWRFLVADDESVGRFIVRDSDSRLNARDRLAVEEWIVSGKSVHTIRDHVNHKRTMNGGLWGGTRGCIPGGIGTIIRDGKFKKMDGYMQDIYLLTDLVWPLVESSHTGHDAYSCSQFASRPFPTRRDDNYQHVGQVFDKDDNPRMGDINGFIRGRKNDPKCRPVDHQDWIYG